MAPTNESPMPYDVPAYTLRNNEVWFHFLHGNVPGHQIDYLYRPEVPQGQLTRQHFSHLTRVLKYIEPRHGRAYAFAIANLSRDDSQYEPGHGAVALIFGLRIKGAKDHAGREDPPFCHAAALANRHVDENALYTAALQFYAKLLGDETHHGKGCAWYQQYAVEAHEHETRAALLRNYVDDFADLYAPDSGGLSFRWSVERSTPPRRVVIVYQDDADFATISRAMVRIAHVLVESDIKWTAISNGREQDVPGGLTVRFVPQRDAMLEGPDIVVMRIEDVPEKPVDIAAQLFHAHEVRISQVSMRAMNWRHGQVLPVMEEKPIMEMVLPERNASTAEMVNVEPEAMLAAPDRAADLKQTLRKQQITTLVGFGALIVLLGGLAILWFGSAPKEQTNSVDATPMMAARSPATTNTVNGVIEDERPLVEEHPEAAVTVATQTNKAAPAKKSTAKTGKTAPGKTKPGSGGPWGGGLVIPPKKAGN